MSHEGQSFHYQYLNNQQPLSWACYVLDTHTCNVSVTVVVTVHGVLSSWGWQRLSLHSVMNKVKAVKGEKLILYLFSLLNNMHKLKPTKMVSVYCSISTSHTTDKRTNCEEALKACI